MVYSWLKKQNNSKSKKIKFDTRISISCHVSALSASWGPCLHQIIDNCPHQQTPLRGLIRGITHNGTAQSLDFFKPVDCGGNFRVQAPQVLPALEQPSRNQTVEK